MLKILLLASSALSLPPEMHGAWCAAGEHQGLTWAYERSTHEKASDDSSCIEVTDRGFVSTEQMCRFERITPDQNPYNMRMTYAVRMTCWGDGPDDHVEMFTFTIINGKLVMHDYGVKE